MTAIQTRQNQGDQLADVDGGNPLPARIVGAVATDAVAKVVYVFHTSVVAALSLATTLAAFYPLRSKLLRRIALTFSMAPTTSENVTLTLAATHANRPDAVLYTRDPSAVAATSLVNTWEDGYWLGPEDELTLAYTNTDTHTIKAEILVEVL